MAWPILLLARELDVGGSERQVTLIAKALDRSRFEPHVGCFRPGGLRGRELEAAGVPIAHFPVYSFASPRALSGALQLARFIRDRRIRLVHTFDYPLTVFAVPLAHLFTRAVVISSQRSHRELIPRGYLNLVRMTDRMVDAIVVNCEFVRRHVESDEGLPPSQVQLCYNGIDLDEFRPPQHRGGDDIVIGVVCALRPEKDLPALLESFANVRRKRPRLKLAIVGSGPMLEALQSQARAVGVYEYCTFGAATDNVAEWLHRIDIFVLPSRSEALSNSLMEAMACGCCAVASNVGGNPELIRDGENGLLFQAGNVPALTAALERVIDNEPLRNKLAAAAQQSIRERFSIRSSADRMADIYSSLIEPRVRSAGAA